MTSDKTARVCVPGPLVWRTNTQFHQDPNRSLVLFEWDIDNDGTIRIASVDGESGREACRRIELITADVEVGRVYDGKVARLMDFGAFVTILPGKDGLVHISQISHERVEKVSDKLSEGDEVKVKVLEVDRQGRVRLSMKEVDAA